MQKKLENGLGRLYEVKKKLGLGGTDICVCPECDYKTKHERGTPCSDMECPKCGAALVGKGMPHGKGQGAK